MANLNINAKKQNTFDAIVIGSGMSGGWAAKELTEKGLKTLVLERGREVRHLRDYPTTNTMPWEFPHRGRIPEEIQRENPVISRCYAFREDAAHFFVKDKEHPYIQEKPFDWIRGYQTGGKSLMWARQTQRWSQYDFEGPDRDGFAVPWPISYDDLAPWYSHVEKFVGISGNPDNIDVLPDGEFLPPMEINCVEDHFSQVVKKEYGGNRHIIIGRCAHITGSAEKFAAQGRTLCQHRNICQRGCPFGGYFSSNSSTLPWAEKTGNMTLRADSVVHSILYDEKEKRAVGVRVIDAKTKEETEYYAKIIFLNAGALNTNLILLNSISNRFPEGLGNDNGLLGKYIAFHNYRAVISAEYDGFPDMHTVGRRPNGMYVPRFRNVKTQETDFLRGYAAGFGADRMVRTDYDGFGETLKNNLLNPSYGPWRVGSHMMGETIPKETNRVTLDKDQTDEWGMPQLRIDVDYDENDEKMIADYFEQFTEMFEKAGFTNIRPYDKKQAPGLDIHEMGGVRMGKDPATSLLNKWNQLHNCKNVYVTDGACMTSTSTQNPSLTYMAFAARAVDHAVREFS
ncbi:GMC oxidoreductase [Fulvivirga sedimenti]|uniref:GMC family oxidoreductase n=1 Tax=Fulvivirga sedimenti TaxID=2879465 RepID=A0A9X1L1L2_9BACT|nr:GMC family oxidoreductase [Fulvivirga sedimenti]MCA6074826.1 GMC family oxidoreductase [Fulvivirga sedimenti]MCA6076003.1 GMC family oxidoreductase [Fulvivirga sedimenti]MCA6077131.1 GMC family oxidoreductase [Fulvivirga sedimenti]